jgi:hypothetical protein
MGRDEVRLEAEDRRYTAGYTPWDKEKTEEIRP